MASDWVCSATGTAECAGKPSGSAVADANQTPVEMSIAGIRSDDVVNRNDIQGAAKRAVKRLAEWQLLRRAGIYLRCLLTSLVISNMDTCFLPPKISLSFSSALMLRLFFAS